MMKASKPSRMSDLRVAAGEVAYPYDFESLRPEAQHQLVRTQAYSTPQHMVDLESDLWLESNQIRPKQIN